MEPDIEKITGEERDITTFMKIMRMFNKVSSKQQEMEIKFELMKKTLVLLKKHDEFEINELEKKFNSTPLRWSNLKSKVTQAKQRLGPTIQEEFNSIVEDLTAFQDVSVQLNNDIVESIIFQRDCLFEDAHKTINEFNEQYTNLQKKADDLKQLQELLDSRIIDFDILNNSKMLLSNLKQVWKVVNDLRKKHEEWELIRWQKINIKSINDETEQQIAILNQLPSDAKSWDVTLGMREDIADIKASVSLFLRCYLAAYES